MPTNLVGKLSRLNSFLQSTTPTYLVEDPKKIEEYVGCDQDMLHDGEDVIVWKAIEAIEYYGAENFSSPYSGYKHDREYIEDVLKNFEIADDVEV